MSKAGRKSQRPKDDPFCSIGWQQSDLFEVLVKKTFEKGYSRESIAALILAAATGGLSTEALHIGQEMVLTAALLAEMDSGIRCYFANYIAINKEITLYWALDIVELADDDDIWINAYQYGISQKIKPRRSLVEQYQKRLKK